MKTEDELAIETLSGDVRDAILTHVRAMEDPWSKMPEAQQQEKIDAVENIACDLVRRAVGLVARQGFDSLNITLRDFTVKEGQIKGKFTCPVNSDYVMRLAAYENLRAVLVLAEAQDYMGESEPAVADPDEPPLFDEDETDTIGETPPALDRRKGKQAEATA